MAQDEIRRFFSPKMALISVGLLGGGLAVGAYVLYRLQSDHVISIGGSVIAAVLLVAGVGLLFSAFPRGCAACRKKLEEGGATFTDRAYDQIAQVMQQGDPGSIAQLSHVPSHDGSGRYTSLTFDYCPGCKGVGLARVSLKKMEAQGSTEERAMPERRLSRDVVGALLQMSSARSQQHRR